MHRCGSVPRLRLGPPRFFIHDNSSLSNTESLKTTARREESIRLESEYNFAARKLFSNGRKNLAALVRIAGIGIGLFSTRARIAINSSTVKEAIHYLYDFVRSFVSGIITLVDQAFSNE